MMPPTPTGVGLTPPRGVGPQMPSPRHPTILFTGRSPSSQQSLYRATVGGVSIQEQPRSSAPALRLRAPGAPSTSEPPTPMDLEVARLRKEAAAEVAAEQAAAAGAPTGSGATTGQAPVVQPEDMDLSRGGDDAGRPSRTITFDK